MNNYYKLETALPVDPNEIGGKYRIKALRDHIGVSGDVINKGMLLGFITEVTEIGGEITRVYFTGNEIQYHVDPLIEELRLIDIKEGRLTTGTRFVRFNSNL